MTVPACIGRIVGYLLVACLAASAMMPGQRKPFVGMRIITPAVHVMAGHAVADGFVRIMIGGCAERDMAIAALLHVGHCKRDEVFMAAGAI